MSQLLRAPEAAAAAPDGAAWGCPECGDALEVATRRHRERMRTAVEEAARQSPAAAQALRRLPDDSKAPVARQ